MTDGPVEWVEENLDSGRLSGEENPESLFKNWDRFSFDTQDRIQKTLLESVEELLPTAAEIEGLETTILDRVEAYLNDDPNHAFDNPSDVVPGFDNMDFDLQEKITEMFTEAVRRQLGEE